MVTGRPAREGMRMETLRISLGELIAGMPTVLGHEPRDSVVAVCINESGLPTCALEVARAVLMSPESASVTAAAIAEELACEFGQTAVLISYTDDGVRSHCPALEALRMEVEFVVPRVEVLAVQHGEWFRPGCFDDCCPRTVPEEPPGFAEIILAARSRADAMGALARRAIQRASERWDRRVAAAAEWETALADGAVADATTARRLAATLDDLCVRDWVVLTILGADGDAVEDALEGTETGAVSFALDAALTGHGKPDLLVTERARAVVERVARAARGKRRRAATHTLAGVLEWWEGNLDEARARCDIALSHDSGYRLAELVRLAATRGIAPGWVAKAGQTAH